MVDSISNEEGRPGYTDANPGLLEIRELSPEDKARKEKKIISNQDEHPLQTDVRRERAFMLMNMNRKARRRIGKANKIKIPGIDLPRLKK